jgi:hypothetical protein
VISREALEQFTKKRTEQSAPAPIEESFDIEAYLSKHGFEVSRRKPWQAHAGGFIFELVECPFNPDHADGSAAFTLVKGVPGFSCKHNGCHGKTIKDVFAIFPADPNREEELEGLTQARLLCELAADVGLFHTDDGVAYGKVPVRHHLETWSLRSKAFRGWLIKKFYDLYQKPPGAQALQNTLELLEARAQYDSPEAPIFVRVGESAGSIYIDLCNAEWEAVEISAAGWRLITNSPIRFRRSKGMKSLPHPARGGTLAILRNLINIGDDDNWLLCTAWLVAAYRPNGPYPILILQGEQGSAKSTTARLLRRLIDPSVALVRTPPRDERDLLIAASNSWLLTYDNLSGIQLWLSDALCRVATGGGFSTRELCTDSDEVFFGGARPICLNGIDYLTGRPDLADRALVLSVPRIEESKRREESEIYADFEHNLPQMFGSLCDAVSTALSRFSHIRLARKPRMADFAAWAAAAAPALGSSQETFEAAYFSNRAEAVQDTLESDSVAVALLQLIEEQTQIDGAGVWEGTCKALLGELERLSADGVKRSRDWPKSPRGLSGRLRRLVTFLRESGVEITFQPKGTRGKRPLTISRTWPHLTATNATTATTDPESSRYQSATTHQPYDGREPEVSDQTPPDAQSPLQPSSANPFDASGTRAHKAVAAEVAVDCNAVLDGETQGGDPGDRVGACVMCGPVEWEWVGGKRVCPICRAPSAAPARVERERFEL